MAQDHETAAAELHATINERSEHKRSVDMTGGSLPAGEKSAFSDVELQPTEDGQEPNDQEKATLRRVGENLPSAAYLVAVVELCERFTCRTQLHGLTT
jgi:proton-dependent oligopeptide transporter, POT family